MKSIDITGLRFGRLVAIKKEFIKNKSQYWSFKCDCGNTTTAKKSHVLYGRIKSCGCLLKENNTGYKHGLSKTRIYNIFKGMKNRCYNPNEPAYKNYGGRGIKICNEWLKNPELFYEWAIKNNYRDDLSIERINVNKGYEPNNCTWILLKNQPKNTRKSIRIAYNNEVKTLSEWCELLNLDKRRTETRLRRGWSVNRAFNTKYALDYWSRRQ